MVEDRKTPSASDHPASDSVLRRVSLTFDALPPDPLGGAASLLATATRIVRGIVEGTQKPGRIDSAAWRVADALLSLREFSERESLPEHMAK